MGVISIRRASERLQAPSAPRGRAVHKANYRIANPAGMGEAASQLANARMNYGRGLENLGRGIEKFAGAIARISADYAAEQRQI